MSAYAAGDARAFERLFARLGPRVHGFFLRSFRAEAVADDLLQETFMKVHRARQRYDTTMKVAPWLFTIAARVRLDELRKRLRLPEDADEEALSRADAQAPRDPPPDTDLQDAVRTALDRLPESQRVVIHLHRYEGMTFPEIAQVLGTTPGAIKLRAFRGYETLRKELEGVLER
ncbi:MAG: RNA polymerase sigma factor [Myxococcales bacterium]|nr:RNA polymerase sigma factor [Myxococcales bacterium]